MGAAISTLSEIEQKILFEEIKSVYDHEYQPRVERGELVKRLIMKLLF